jgi:DNA-binding LytR/AlgR family response regulator
MKVYFQILQDKKTILVPLRDVIFFRGSGCYTYVYVIGAEKPYLIPRTLSAVLKGVENYDKFVRIHKSYIVNIIHIINIDNSNRAVLMRNKEVVTISIRAFRNYKQLFGIVN